MFPRRTFLGFLRTASTIFSLQWLCYRFAAAFSLDELLKQAKLKLEACNTKMSLMLDAEAVRRMPYHSAGGKRLSVLKLESKDDQGQCLLLFCLSTLV